MAEQEQERINFEAALELQRQLNEREEVPAEATQTQTIDWSDPAVLRYHALQNRPYSVAEVRKNMVMYLKNQAGYKQSFFKGMKYEEIRPIFEKVWDQTHTFVSMDSEDKEKGTEKKSGGTRKKTLAKKRAGEKQSDQSAKRQKTEYDTEKEELKAYLDIVPGEEFAMDFESLATKADGSSKNYKIFSEMLDDFDRHDVFGLHRLVKARYMTSSPEGYNLMLWGDLKILFEPDEEDEVWKNQHGYNLISWRLFDSCGIHILLINNGIAIHMMTEKKYPLNQEMLSRMLSKRLEVDHESTMAYELLKFIKSQVKCKYETRNMGNGPNNEENTDSYETLRHNTYDNVTPLWFRWISFDYRVTLGFGSIAGGLDHVNLVIRLPIEHGISRVLGITGIIGQTKDIYSDLPSLHDSRSGSLPVSALVRFVSVPDEHYEQVEETTRRLDTYGDVQVCSLETLTRLHSSTWATKWLKRLVAYPKCNRDSYEIFLAAIQEADLEHCLEHAVSSSYRANSGE
ncbi:hypothetical protein Tco_0900688 [Tanacetum coccineum]